MKLIDLKFLVDDLVRTQDQKVREQWSYLAMFEMDTCINWLSLEEVYQRSEEELQEEIRKMRIDQKRDEGYLEALKLIQEKLKEL